MTFLFLFGVFLSRLLWRTQSNEYILLENETRASSSGWGTRFPLLFILLLLCPRNPTSENNASALGYIIILASFLLPFCTVCETSFSQHTMSYFFLPKLSVENLFNFFPIVNKNIYRKNEPNRLMKFLKISRNLTGIILRSKQITLRQCHNYYLEER